MGSLYVYLQAKIDFQKRNIYFLPSLENFLKIKKQYNFNLKEKTYFSLFTMW